MKFYETPEFKALNAMWRDKLARKNSGFTDLEDAEGNITPLTRELNRDPRVDKSGDYFATLEYHLKLTAWLATKPKLCAKHRRILEAHSTGAFNPFIADKYRLGLRTVERIIANARKIFMAF